MPNCVGFHKMVKRQVVYNGCLVSHIAFAELQTDLGELVTEDALDSNQLPFHNFPTYATKVFFPSAGIHHPVLSEPRVCTVYVCIYYSLFTFTITSKLGYDDFICNVVYSLMS